MITRERAQQLIQDWLDDLSSADRHLVVVPELTLEEELGWTFFYDSREHLDAGTFETSLLGNAPVFIQRDNGVMHGLGTAAAPEAFLAPIRGLLIDGWRFEVEEIAVGVWQATATHPDGRSAERLAGDKVGAVQRVRAACGELAHGTSIPTLSEVDRFFHRIREVIPTFVEVDEDRRHDWAAADGEGDLHYMRMSALANHLVELSERGASGPIRHALNVVEATLTSSGDQATRDLLIEGLLEDMQSACLRTDGRIRLLDVRALLGTKSRQAWDELMVFWHGTGAAARALLPPGSLPDDAA